MGITIVRFLFVQISQNSLVKEPRLDWFKPVYVYWSELTDLSMSLKNYNFIPFFAKITLRTICLSISRYK